MKQRLLATLIGIMAFGSIAAQDYYGFYEQSLKNNNTGMYVLGSWALLNMATGAIGWSNGSGENKYFHQMNVFWNTVNLSIAGFALYSSLHTDMAALSNEKIIRRHIKTEHLYLINAGLDILYIGTGFWLKNLSERKTKNQSLLAGYGNSIILQGGFLFVFDLVIYGIQHFHRMQFLDHVNLAYGINSFGCTINF